MIPRDIISRVNRAHDAAITAAIRWGAAVAAGRKTVGPHERYVRAEDRFSSAMARLIQATERY